MSYKCVDCNAEYALYSYSRGYWVACKNRCKECYLNRYHRKNPRKLYKENSSQFYKKAFLHEHKLLLEAEEQIDKLEAQVKRLMTNDLS